MWLLLFFLFQATIYPSTRNLISINLESPQSFQGSGSSLWSCVQGLMRLMEHQSMNIATCPLSLPSALAFVKMPLLPLGLQSSHVGHYGAHFIYYCQVSTGQNLSASLVFCYIFGCNQKTGNSRITQVNLPKNPLQASLVYASCYISK